MKLKLLCLVIGLQVAWILGTVARQEYGLARGATALLETRPVDPRDLLRGDYVILGELHNLVPPSARAARLSGIRQLRILTGICLPI